MLDDEKVSILVVDDLPEKLLVMESVLEGLNQNLVTARSGREALRRLLERDFAVILLDVNMPEMDGFETARMIRSRQRTAHTPIIFITAFSDEMHTAQGYSLGAVDYILSPVVPEVLRTKVGVFVDLYRKTRQVMRQAEEHIALAREQAARAAAEAASHRAAFLAEASASLMKSLDYEATLRALVGVAVPNLGDFCAVTIVDDRTDVMRTEIGLITPQADPTPPDTIVGDLPGPLGEAVRRVLASGTSELLSASRVGGLHGENGDPHSNELPRAWASALIVPLQARGQVFGTLAIGTSAAEGRRLERSDQELAQDLAGRAAIAIDNARLHRNIREDDQRKNEFLAMLAHELRNPLAPIRNAVEIIRRSGSKEAELGWAGDVIARQVEQMVRLVDDLLDISRITGGKIQLRKGPIDVAAAVEYAVEASRPLIEARSQRFVVALPDEPLFVDADKARLAQVLANVLNNAAKYTGEGGQVWLNVEREHEEAIFRVRDSGIGIPREMLSRVFDLFTQVDRSLDRSHGGLGIGLTLVRRLIEMHGGSVHAFSEGPNRGSEFVIRLPAIDPESLPIEGDRDVREEIETSACRVMIVDDNEDAARSLARLLSLGGHEVLTCFDGPSALERVSAFRPEFVLLDIGLPGMDGYEVAKHLRRLPSTGRIVLTALTGYGQEEDRRRTREAGFDHHLVKPVELDYLMEMISNCGDQSANGRSENHAEGCSGS